MDIKVLEKRLALVKANADAGDNHAKREVKCLEELIKSVSKKQNKAINQDDITTR